MYVNQPVSFYLSPTDFRVAIAKSADCSMANMHLIMWHLHSGSFVYLGQ